MSDPLPEANAWRKVWDRWGNHPDFQKVSAELIDDGCYSAATAINEWIERLLERAKKDE